MINTFAEEIAFELERLQIRADVSSVWMHHDEADASGVTRYNYERTIVKFKSTEDMNCFKLLGDYKELDFINVLELMVAQC